MRRTILLAALALGACKTSTATPDARPAATSQAAGPFEVAEAWIGAPVGVSEGSRELLRSFVQPVVERLHRAEGGRYKALVADGDGNPEGILLTLVRETEGWAVESEEIVASDYLWPSQ